MHWSKCPFECSSFLGSSTIDWLNRSSILYYIVQNISDLNQIYLVCEIISLRWFWCIPGWNVFLEIYNAKTYILEMNTMLKCFYLCTLYEYFGFFYMVKDQIFNQILEIKSFGMSILVVECSNSCWIWKLITNQKTTKMIETKIHFQLKWLVKWIYELSEWWLKSIFIQKNKIW